jgi:hypothetical protein
VKKRFGCVIGSEGKLYKAEHYDPVARRIEVDDDTFMKLSPREIDVVKLMIISKDEGVYRLSVRVDLSVAGKSGSIEIGPFDGIRYIHLDTASKH